ncbi:M4 family metallopeptidase [Aquimarina longa]|uniref:M4 family metallopeptidase n=1 Tax=Aquimarina longa TaxID=1080221 RepID=UPI000785675A|nr:M4 family metallopeptidase [Aquimarina longa]
MKNFKRKPMLAIALGLTFSCLTAQEKQESFSQPPTFIEINDNEAKQLKSSKTIFNNYLGLDESNTYLKIKQETDELGLTHDKYRQIYKGIPVEFGTTTIDLKNGKAKSLHGEYYNVTNLDITPKISQNQVLQKAIAYVGAKEYFWEDVEAAKTADYTKPTGKLVVLPNLDSKNKDGAVTKYHLAYKIDIYAKQPLSRGYVFIDAHTGEQLDYQTTIYHTGEHSNSSKNLKIIPSSKSVLEHFDEDVFADGNAATRYSGNRTITTRQISGSYVLRDNTRGGGVNTYNSGKQRSYPTTNFTDSDNNWTATEYNNAAKDNAALDAHWGSIQTYNYWKDKHNRNSYDGNGAAINSWVHYGTDYDNAFWLNGRMTYGDGTSNGQEGNGVFDALTSIDVAAHEIGHAVTEHTANLRYQRESGALNEGYSDIWGAAVEHFAKGNGNDSAPSENTWLIGDEIDRRNGSVGLRSMKNPKDTKGPDTYRGTNWKAATVGEGCQTPIKETNDYCGVHTNSSVLNFWFYLTVAGSSATDGVNDNGDTYNVAGIGMDKAAKIAYRAVNLYLSANSTFANARTATIRAAKELYTAGGAEEKGVTNAWHAVGVGAAFSGGGNPTDYCASNGKSTSDEYISKVALGTISKTSAAGSGGYSDFTAESTKLTKGNSNTITVTPKWTGTTYDEGYAVWIDYNQDGDFADTGELVWSKAASKTTPISGSFTVPSSAKNGKTRMRVSMKYNGIPTSCESFSYGEVEDYSVDIDETNGGGDTDPCTGVAPYDGSTTYQVGDRVTYRGQLYERISGDWKVIGSCGTPVISYSATSLMNDNLLTDSTSLFKFYPNPAKGFIMIQINGLADANYRIINQIGQTVKNGKASQNKVELNDLPSGLYFISVTSNNETLTKRFIKQ